MSQDAEKKYQERVKRILDTIALKKTDRIPVFGPYQLYPYTYAGTVFKDAMYDYDVAGKAAHKFLDDFKPDADFGPIMAFPAKAMDILGLQWFRWPGKGVGDHVMYQFVEGEYMTGDEYDEFVYDSSHYMATKWIPRSFANLSGMSSFPFMRLMMWFGWTGQFAALANDEVWEALKVAREAGLELNKWFTAFGKYADEIKEKGFPVAFGSFSWAPFDIIGDTLRGTRGIMGDLIRRPDKVLKALEISTQMTIDYGTAAAGADLPLSWIWLHKGSEGFMSDEQYAKFYWPSLREAIEGMVDKGVIPVVYCEGQDTSRLKYFTEVPPGKVMFHFAQMDMKKAKEMLGDIACFSGNIPNHLMITGTPEDIKDYCKMLIDTCGPGGGYIMDTDALLDEAKTENLKAMFEFTREYGVFSQ